MCDEEGPTYGGAMEGPTRGLWGGQMCPSLWGARTPAVAAGSIQQQSGSYSQGVE